MLKNDERRRLEHEAIRNNVGFHEYTHDLIEVSGDDAAKFLDYIFVNDVYNLNIDDNVYTTMLDESGGIIDDVIIIRKNEGTFHVSTLRGEKMIEWLESHKNDFKVTIKNVKHQNRMITIQGPKSRDLVNELINETIDDLKRFHVREYTVSDETVEIMRAGFTGELGYEVYVRPEFKDEFIERIKTVGEKYNLTEVITNIYHDSIPMEKGYILLEDIKGLTPHEAGLGWTVDWGKDFIGKEKILNDNKRETRSPNEVKGLLVDEYIESETPITFNGEKVGKVIRVVYGYTVEQYIGFALVDTSKVKENSVVEVGNNKGKIVKRKFYDLNDERVKATE